MNSSKNDSDLDMVAVVMAGGTGTRFWPLSREERPKQVLSLGDRPALLTDTLDRLQTTLPPERIVVITSREHEKPVRSLCEALPKQNVVVEPEGRNTAACAALGGLIVCEQFGPETVMGLFPADHHIKPTKAFARALDTAYETVRSQGGIVTLGITPSRPDTGYGYIHAESPTAERIEGQEVHVVESFTEKPDEETARRYIKQGDYFWNSGMFFWTADHVLSETHRHLPSLHRGVMAIRDRWQQTGDLPGALQEHYRKLPSISVDYGILEQTETVWTLPVEFTWSDLGTWDSLAEVLPPDGNQNVEIGEVYSMQSAGCILMSCTDTLTATLGTDEMIVVATGDAVLVCPKDRAQDVKQLVSKLREAGYEQYL